MTTLEGVRKDIGYIKEKLDDKISRVDEHLKESAPIRIIVHDNEQFRKSSIWVIRAMIVTIFGIIGKILWFK